MKKPTMSLALSVSLALAQAGWQVAGANSPIWQNMAGTADKQNKSGTKKVTSNKVAARTKKNVRTAHGAAAKPSAPSPVMAEVPASLTEAHTLLFLSGRDKSAAAISGAPAPTAALSIHPALPTNIESSPIAANEPDTTTPSVGPQSEIPIDENIKAAQAKPKSDDLIAQFTSENLQLAQNEGGGKITASPIPPVVTGTVDFEEFKPTNVIDLKVSRSRTFKLRNKIVRTSISDPGVAEPVVVAENQMVLLGKSPGRATLVLWDDAGNNSAIELRVSRDYTQLQSTLREIDPRIVVKTYSIGGTDRVILLGDVDHVESVIRAF